MSEVPIKHTVSKILFNLAMVVIIIAGVSAAKDILVPILLAIFVAIISAQPLFWLRKKGLPNWLSLIIVVLGVFLISFVIISLVGTSIKEFTDNLPAYEDNLKQQSLDTLNWLEGLGIETSDVDITRVINPGAAMKLTGKLFNGIGNTLANAFLILMIVIFILLEASSFPKKLSKIFSDEKDTSRDRFDEFLKTMNQYVVIKTIVSIITGVVITIFLSILGIDYAILWGLTAFALNYVPNIGSIIAAIPAVLLCIIQFGLLKALIVVVGYTVLNVVMGNLVEPRYMGRGLGLSPLVVFFSLLFWGWVLGPVGMFISVPLTVTAKIVLAGREESQWVSVLLGPVPKTPSHETEPEKNSD